MLFGHCTLAMRRLAFVVCLFLPQPALTAPNEPDAYTAHVAKLLAAEAPEMSIAVRKRLTLGVKASADDEEMQASLDRVWEFCRRNARDCDDATATFVRNAAGMIRDQLGPIEASTIRVVVRPTEYAEQARKTFTGHPQAKPDQEPIMQLFVGDLWLVCVADRPTSMRVLNRGDIAKLGLSAEQAMDLGRKNVGASLRPLSDVVRPLPPEGFAYIEDTEYESSRILLHGAWAELAAKMSGDLIVAVPEDRLTVYGDSGRPRAKTAMAGFVRYAADRMQRPVSTSLFRWTPSGWESVSP